MKSRAIQFRECQVIPFPVIRRIGKIRRTVEVLSVRHGKAGDQYWRQVVAGMRGQMEKAGLPEATIFAELSAFLDVVHRELYRAEIVRLRQDDDGAA